MSNNSTSQIQMVADFEGDPSTLLTTMETGEYPILCTRDMVMFPTVLTPILVGRAESKAVVQLLEKNPEQIIGVFTQKDSQVEKPQQEDLYDIGTFAKLVKVINMPSDESNITIILQGLGKAQLNKLTSNSPYYKAELSYLSEVWPKYNEKDPHPMDDDFWWTSDTLFKETIRYIQSNEMLPNELVYAINEISNRCIKVGFICTNLPFPVEDKIAMLKANHLNERTMEALKALNKAKTLLSLQQDISRKTQYDLDEQQKEYFLKQQIKNIKEELGEGNPREKQDLLDKAAKKKWNEATQKIFQKEMEKLDTISPQSPDYPIQVTYLQTLVDLPWNEYTTDDQNLQHAEKTLNHDHYGMEKVKERILEYLAVRSLNGGLHSPILCLVGPPGVGKTSLGKSIASAMKRKYVRMSLGGLHDEAEIRGHRRTYIGAMPGRILKNIQKAGSSNPVFVLDEIDKVAKNNYNGDPTSALLEVLDPEQNTTFHDNYLDVDYDLSKVLFIATANDLSTVPRPLLDRMELIQVDGYITEEKVEIAKRHLLPKELVATGLDTQKPKISFSKGALEEIIEHYTRESGVRQLKRQINKALRKLAYKLAYDGKLEKHTIGTADVKELLGNPIFIRDIYQGNDFAGVVTGLAWTAAGGEILFIETSLSRGRGGKLTVTGNLGDVMKESAVISLEYVKAHCDLLGVDYRIFENWNIHIHVPEGATPKDGPSAGITIATSIASAITQRKVRKNTAMTGEITLRGKVLPVGGIKEKLLAAKRAGITHLVLCKDNEKNVKEIPEKYLKGVDFHYVETVADVWEYALTDEKVKNPIDFTIEEENEKDK